MDEKNKLRGYYYYIHLFGEPEWLTPEIWLQKMQKAKREEDLKLFKGGGYCIFFENGRVVCVLPTN